MGVLKKALFSTGNGRILGLETEYVVSCVPTWEKPPAWLLLWGIEQAVLQQGRLCESTNEGYFLANGGALHFESHLERRDNPVIELATPECIDPWELLRYVRAQEVLLENLATVVERFLRDHGYPGRVLFIRSNQDWQGQRLGCHENYWIQWRESWPFALAGALIAFLTALGMAAVNLFITLTYHVGYRFLSTLLQRYKKVVRKNRRRSGWSFLKSRRNRLKMPQLSPFFLGIRRCVLRSLIFLAEPLLEFFVMPRLSRELLPFLATRQIFAGAGALRFKPGATALHLSARADSLGEKTGISFGQRDKAVFDLKPFLREPMSLLRRRKRLCIAGGDSLMGESALFLSMGTTSLVLSMLEAGEHFSTIFCPEPLAAWRQVAEKGPRARVTVWNRETWSALDIQRVYLERAKRFFHDAKPDSLPGQVIRLWDSMLKGLKENPASLWGQVDWVTKKGLMDPVVLAESNWKAFNEWGAFFQTLRRAMPETVMLSGLTPEAAMQYLRPQEARQFIRFFKDPDAFRKQRDLYLACSKIDLGFHEISRHGGYYQKLRMSGDVPDLVRRDDAVAALTEAPKRTRANIRARAIAMTQSPGDMEASWDSIHIHASNLRIKIRDPLVHL